MASTNKTTNYELSQFVGSDKPAWLSDYNSDMSKIDAGVHTAQTTATGADGKADANTTNIGDLSYLSTSVKTNLVAAINEVDGNTDTAQNTANQAYSTANTASLKINSLEQALNLTSINTCSVSKSNNISGIISQNIKCATNTAQSLFKLYGQVAIEAPSNTTNGVLTITNTGLGSRDSDYNIEGAVLSFRNDGATNVLNLTVKEDGTVLISGINFGAATATRIYIAPTLYFDDNFGD